MGKKAALPHRFFSRPRLIKISGSMNPLFKSQITIFELQVKVFHSSDYLPPFWHWQWCWQLWPHLPYGHCSWHWNGWFNRSSCIIFWFGFKLFIIIQFSLFLTPPSPLYSQGDSDTVRWHGRSVPRCSNHTVPWMQLKQCLQTNKQGASQSMEWFPDDCGDKQDTQVETCSRGGKCR